MFFWDQCLSSYLLQDCNDCFADYVLGILRKKSEGPKPWKKLQASGKDDKVLLIRQEYNQDMFKVQWGRETPSGCNHLALPLGENETSGGFWHSDTEGVLPPGSIPVISLEQGPSLKTQSFWIMISARCMICQTCKSSVLRPFLHEPRNLFRSR